MTENTTTTISQLDRYPFLSYIEYGGDGYLGIIQNHNSAVTSIYHFDSLVTNSEKRRFLELGDEWWWQSNRQIPINVFLKADWAPFRSTLKTFNSKDVIIKFGPYVDICEIANKRSKRRSITLVKKVK